MHLKRLFTLFLALCLLFSMSACNGNAGGIGSGEDPTEETEEVDVMALRATALKVNNLSTPLGIDTAPVFGWTNRTETVGRLQTAYQIIVASTKELAQTGTGDIWDTGKTESAINFDIDYAGKPLTSFTDYYWSVRVWDETDTPSDWTKVARFGTGALAQTDWTAKWIGSQYYVAGQSIIPAPMLRKGFALNKAVKTAKIYICGLGLFELKVNGQLPDDSVLNPADTQYEDTVSYCAYDVTKLLAEGANAVTVELGCGFYNLPEHISAGFYRGVWKDDPKLLLEMHIEYENGEKEVIVSDESWKCYEDGPILKNSIYTGEIYDATKEVDGWTSADFDDSGWSNARLADAPKGKLKFENMEPMRRIETVTPTVEKVDGSTWLVRCNEFHTGWARIVFNEAKKGHQIKIRYFQSESERDSGGVFVANAGNSAEKYELQVYTYRAKGVAGEAYEPKFSYAGYTLLEVSGYSGELKPEDITCYTVATDVEHIGSFESGNEQVNQLHDMMVRTMICNMQGKPTDTPIFEKLGWTGDYNGAIKTFNYNFDTSSFISHFLHNLRDTSLETGRIQEFSPSGYISLYDAPCWSQMYVNSIYAAWHEHGQLSLVEEHYDWMQTTVDYYIRRISEGGNWIWNEPNKLGDWASPNGSISPTTAPAEGGTLYSTAAVYRVLLEFVEISEALGKTENIKKYQDAADKIYKDFNKTFYNKEKGIYETGYWNGSTTRTKYRQASNLVPLYFGLCPDKYRETVLDNLIKDIQSKGNHLDVGNIGAEIILPLLSAEGYGDLALEILLQNDYPSWGYWLTLGSTTCHESWTGKGRSVCHFFLGTYDEWLYQNLAGIQNPKNGYETVVIRPEIYKELGFVTASVDTVRGKLVSAWKVDENNRLTVTVTVPVGTTADLLLPVSADHEILLDGTALSVRTGVQEIGQQDGRTLVRLISGSYTFDLGTDAV